MPLTLGERRPLALETIVDQAIKDSLRENGKVRGYGSDASNKQPRPGPDAQRKGVLSFPTMRRIFRQNDLVRSVVLTKARQIVSLDFDIQRADETHFAPQGLARLIKQLFTSPNTDRQDWTSFMLEVLTDALVIDAGVIEKVRDPQGNLVELVAHDGATFTPKVDDHKRLKGYDQVVRTRDGETKTVKFKPEDIVYLKFNPSTDSVWGTSPLEALAIAIGGDVMAMNRNVAWLQDGNLMDNILILGRVGQAALTNFKQFFEDNSGEMGRLPILSDMEDGGAGAKLLQLRGTNRDMQFLEFDRWLFQRICAGYQVAPDDVIPLEATATKATAEQQAEISKSKGLRPEVAIIEGRFTCDIVQEFHSNLAFRFIEADKTDSNEEALVWGTFFRNGGVLNELRKQAGMPPLQGPRVDIEGVMTNSYDLPINAFTGLPFGVQAPSPFADQFGGGDSGGGDSSGDPFKSLALALRKAQQGRRRSPRPDPAQRALAAYEGDRAYLVERAQARLRRARGADALALGSALPASIPGSSEGSLLR